MIEMVREKDSENEKIKKNKKNRKLSSVHEDTSQDSRPVQNREMKQKRKPLSGIPFSSEEKLELASESLRKNSKKQKDGDNTDTSKDNASSMVKSNEPVKKKEKKTKRKGEDVMSDYAPNDNMGVSELSNEAVKKKSKKKRKKLEDDVNSDTRNDNIDITEKQVCDSDPKPKKKKRKHKEGVDTAIKKSTISGTEEQVCDSEPKQKKKKRKHEDNVDTSIMQDNISVTEEQSCDSEPKPSKKKSKMSSELEESSLGVVDSSILKQAEINLGLPLAKEVKAEEDEPAKTKKKKKKDKKSTKKSHQEKEEATLIEKALEYLNTWHTQRKGWKFNKHLQVKLLHVVYDKHQLTDEMFSILLLYLEGLNGKSREKTKEDAGKLLADAESETTDVDPEKEERARQIFQLLS